MTKFDDLTPESIDEPTGEATLEDELFPEQETPAEPKTPLTARGVAVAGARVVTGAIGIAVAVAAIAGAALLPLPTVRSEPAALEVIPVPTAQQLVCSGALLRLSDDTGQGATTPSAIGRPIVRSFSSSGDVDDSALGQSDAATGGTAAAPTVISTPPNEADPATRILISGAQSQSANDGDFVGLAASGCAAVSGDTWLAGGATTVGRTTLLTLSNPTEVPATVNLQLYGENGPITAPGTSGIVVPADGQRVLSLAGFQPEVISPVVHVTSTGGQVVAELQQAIVRGLVPGGVDIIGASTSPSLENVIPGLVVTDTESVEKLAGGGVGTEDLRTVLRLFAPGEGSVSTTISVIPEDGVGTGTSFALEVDAGRVLDVPIADLGNGSYTVRIESDEPLLAAARVSAAAGSVSDFAWLSTAPELSGRAQLTIAPGPSPVLHLANGSAEPASIVLEASTGDDVTVEVAAGATASVPVIAGTTYAFDGFPGLSAAVTLGSGGEIAWYAAKPPGVGSAPVIVFP